MIRLFYVLPQQASNNIFSGEISILGTLANPSVSVKVNNASLNLQGENLELQCFASLDDKVIKLTDTSITFSSFTFDNIEANLDIQTFTGGLSGEARTFLDQNNEIVTMFSASILPTSPMNVKEDGSSIFNTKLPETFLASLSLPLINSTKYGQITDFSLTIVRSKGRFDIQGGAGENRSFTDNPINGYLLDSGECLLILDEELPVSFVAFGSIAKGLFDIQVNDLLFDAQGFKKIFDLGVFKIHSGVAQGAFHLGGLLTDPEFNGSVDVIDFSCEVPDYIEGAITAVNAQLTSRGKYLSAENVFARTNNGNCAVDVAINLTMAI